MSHFSIPCYASHDSRPFKQATMSQTASMFRVLTGLWLHGIWLKSLWRRSTKELPGRNGNESLRGTSNAQTLYFIKVFKGAERLSSCWTDDRPETTSAEILILLELFSSRSARRFPLVNDPRILSAFSLRFDIGWRRSSCLSRCLSSEVEKIIQLDEVSNKGLSWS